MDTLLFLKLLEIEGRNAWRKKTHKVGKTPESFVVWARCGGDRAKVSQCADRAKYQSAKRWVNAVNNWGQMGRWDFQVCKDPQMLGKELEWLNKQSFKS